MACENESFLPLKEVVRLILARAGLSNMEAERGRKQGEVRVPEIW